MNSKIEESNLDTALDESYVFLMRDSNGEEFVPETVMEESDDDVMKLAEEHLEAVQDPEDVGGHGNFLNFLNEPPVKYFNGEDSNWSPNFIDPWHKKLMAQGVHIHGYGINDFAHKTDSDSEVRDDHGDDPMMPEQLPLNPFKLPLPMELADGDDEASVEPFNGYWEDSQELEPIEIQIDSDQVGEDDGAHDDFARRISESEVVDDNNGDPVIQPASHFLTKVDLSRMAERDQEEKAVLDLQHFHNQIQDVQKQTRSIQIMLTQYQNMLGEQKRVLQDFFTSQQEKLEPTKVAVVAENGEELAVPEATSFWYDPENKPVLEYLYLIMPKARDVDLS